jgi:phosphoglycerate dehydrogenase-like enzyme
MRSALLLGRLCHDNQPQLQAHLATSWQLESWVPGEPAESLEKLCSGSDAIVLGGDGAMARDWDRFLPASSRLRLLQLTFAGHEFLKWERLPGECAVCNVHTNASSVAEWVMACILESALSLRKMDADLRAGSWRYSLARGDLLHGEVRGKTLGIVGYGHIGREVARRAAAFGMQVAAVSRRRPDDRALAWSETTDRIDELLRQSDYVLLACDLNEATRGLIDARRLSCMKASGILINVSRGAVVVESALYEALRTRVIAGAAIDVWYRYPKGKGESCKPGSFPFEELDNIVMTAHCAAATDEQNTRRWQAIARNLDRLALGEPLENRVVRPQERQTT